MTRRLLIASALAAFSLSIQTSAVIALATPGTSPAGTAAAPDLNPPAAQLRVAMGAALAEHAFLLGEAMRTGIGGGDDFDAAGRALEANSQGIIDVISDVYGEAAASQFSRLWRSHVAYLVDYTRALKNDDQDAQDLAEHQLHTYVEEFSSFLAAANPNLPQAAVSELIAEHVAQLETVAAFDTADYAEAYPGLRATYEHMFVVGDALSEAIALQFPERFGGHAIAFGRASDLRVTLDRLLGEHTFLSALSMRTQLREAGDKAAAREALDANSRELAAAIGDIYGASAAAAFAELWQRHTDGYLAYVVATVEDDQIARQRAFEALADYQTDFTTFLTDANPNLASSDLTELLHHHTKQLIDQADEYAEENYDDAYTLLREAHAHALVMGDALAAAIATQFPLRFLPDTALPAGAQEPSKTGAWLLLTAVLIAVASSRPLFATRRLPRQGRDGLDGSGLPHRRQ